MVDTGASPRVLSSTHEPVLSAATQVRRRLRAHLASWGVADDAADDALLVTEELVANALDHGRSRFDVVVRLDGDVLRVAVRDGVTAAPVLRPFDPSAARGRGLQVVANLARRWGWAPHPDGKTVWAELAV